jgi:hypothetical protein
MGWSDNEGTVDAEVYLQVEPKFYGSMGGEPLVREAKVVGYTLTRPRRPRSGTVTMKMTLRLPKAAFLPLRPEAVVVVPADMVVANLPVEVEATSPE